MARTTRTIHLALVDGDRVWVDPGGDLPAFTHDPEESGSSATARAAHVLTDAAHLAPPVRLTGSDDRVHVLAPRGGTPARGRWAALDALPDRLRAPVETALAQVGDGRPEHRPDWYRPGWHDEVEAWVDAVLPDGRRRTGPLRTYRIWSVSAVLTVTTDAGVLWFKAGCEHFGAEAGITEVVTRRLPDLGPTLVAVDRERCWLLTEPLAGVSQDGAPVAAARVLAPAWAQAQVDSLGWLEELRDAGAPDRGLEPTLAAWHAALDTHPELDALTTDERTRLDRVVPWVGGRLRELWGCGFPDTLAHGDLHAGNVSYDGGRARMFDWSDGCLTHPFLDGTHLAHWIAGDGNGDGNGAEQARTVLAPWREAFPDADFDRALALAPLADLVFQTVTFDAIARGTEAGAGDFDGVVVMLTRQVLASTEAWDTD